MRFFCYFDRPSQGVALWSRVAGGHACVSHLESNDENSVGGQPFCTDEQIRLSLRVCFIEDERKLTVASSSVLHWPGPGRLELMSLNRIELMF